MHLPPASANSTPNAQLITRLHHEGRVVLRLLMICLALAGYAPDEIAEVVFYHPRTVRRWLERYAQEGFAGLPDRPRSGRPRLGSLHLGDRLVRYLAEPRQWTTARIRRNLRLYLSVRTVRRRLREVAAWRRPRLVAKGDPEAKQRWAKVRRAIAALPRGAVVLAEDECHIDLLPWVRSTWIACGQRLRVLTPGQNQRRTLFGAIDIGRGRWIWTVTKSANSAGFCAFLEQVLAAYPSAPAIALVLDNVIIHSSRAVQAWLAEHPRMHLLYGARYCPHQNPVERVWGALKADLANSPPPTMAGRLHQARHFFRQRSPDAMLTTAAPWRAPWLPPHYGQNLWPPA